MVEDTRRSAARQVALVAVVFIAALVLIVGLSSTLGRSGSTASATGSPSAGGSQAAGSIATPGASGSGAASPGDGSPGASGAPASGAPASGAPASTSPSPSASRLPGPGQDVVLVGAGDIGDCTTKEDSEATASLIEGVDGFVFTAGDNAYPGGSLEQFTDCYAPSWGAFLDRTILPSPGNHDWGDPDLAGYRTYFGTRAEPDGTTWYSMDLGSWHVVVLDSECQHVGGCDAGSPQGRWLHDDLAASKAVCTLAIWHKPRWSSGEHGDIEAVGPFWDELYAAGADLVINGHDHDYERFAPQDPAGQEDRAKGIREFVVGTGGAELRDLAEPAANSELTIAKTAGVMQLTLKADSYEWTFMPTTGGVTDSGAQGCH